MKEKLKNMLLDFQAVYDKTADLIDEIEDEELKEQMEFCLSGIGCAIDNFEEEIDVWEE